MNFRKIFCVTLSLILCGLSMLTMNSCIKENTDDCPPEESSVRIVVRTIAETRSGSGDGIENITIYIFDEYNRYAGQWQGGAYTYGDTYEAVINIEPGIYHFVVWSNLGTQYHTAQETSQADNLTITVDYPSDGIISTDVADLHHGMLTSAEVLAGTDNEFTVTIVPNTYKLNFTVEGLPATGDNYTFSVKDNYIGFLYDNTVIEQKENAIEYVRTTGFSGEELEASMKVLKILDGRTPVFDFKNHNTGESLFTDDLVDLIKKAYSKANQTVDFNTMFEFDIKISFHGLLDVTITVNGWSYTVNDRPLT